MRSQCPNYFSLFDDLQYYSYLAYCAKHFLIWRLLYLAYFLYSSPCLHFRLLHTTQYSLINLFRSSSFRDPQKRFSLLGYRYSLLELFLTFHIIAYNTWQITVLLFTSNLDVCYGSICSNYHLCCFIHVFMFFTDFLQLF